MNNDSNIEIKQRCEALLTGLNVLQAGQQIKVEPLTGGVSSDIARVSVGNKTLCVKFARSKLKVEADWFAPVHRNASEFAWLKVAAIVAPESAIELHGHSETLHGFAMEFVAGDDVYLWKDNLLTEQQPHGESEAVGSLLGRIHAASAASGFDQSAFHNHTDFHALRIEPYLLYTTSKHPDIASQIQSVANSLNTRRQVLTHGDVSPKNILFRPAGPILLDAECATMGDASFDIAFCLNHLMLKSIHLPATKHSLLKGVQEFWNAYQPCIDWESAADLQARTCRLLPMLMLARVDGKSPVEYLTTNEQALVREISRRLIHNPTSLLTDLVTQVNTLSVELQP